MKPVISPYIIGAGGVTSYLLPCLIRAFDIRNLSIQDKDLLEDRNLDRQLFTQSQIGMNKAIALTRLLRIKATVIQEWFTETDSIPSEFDLVICAADNHAARRNAISAARRAKIPAVIAGNEYYDSQVLLYYPQSAQYEEIDPIKIYPEIETEEGGNPVRCQGAEQEVYPQLALANMRAASQVLDIIWALKTQAQEAYIPCEIATTRGNTEIVFIHERQ